MGIVFALTAVGYGVMAIRAMRFGPPQAGSAGYQLMRVLDEHGAAIMGIELAVLAAATIGAIGWDRYMDEKQYAARQRAAAAPPSSTEESHV